MHVLLWLAHHTILKVPQKMRLRQRQQGMSQDSWPHLTPDRRTCNACAEAVMSRQLMDRLCSHKQAPRWHQGKIRGPTTSKGTRQHEASEQPSQEPFWIDAAVGTPATPVTA